MTPLFFQEEVFLDCSKDLATSACTFTFKGKEIYLKHTLEIKPKQRVHRMTCKVDGQTFNFGAGRSTLGGGTFGIWPKIMIEGISYRFRINWSFGEGQKGIKFEAENIPKQIPDEELDAPSGSRKLQHLIHEIRNEFKDLNQQISNQEEADDVEGFLHIHTLTPERRKQIIEQLKKRKE
jgi:hypothetical protein